MTIFVKNKHTLEIDEFKLIDVVLVKKDQQRIRKKVIKKHQKENLKLTTFILEKIVKKNHLLY